jgi:hypothetical protein
MRQRCLGEFDDRTQHDCPECLAGFQQSASIVTKGAAPSFVRSLGRGLEGQGHSPQGGQSRSDSDAGYHESRYITGSELFFDGGQVRIQATVCYVWTGRQDSSRQGRYQRCRPAIRVLVFKNADPGYFISHVDVRQGQRS